MITGASPLTDTTSLAIDYTTMATSSSNPITPGGGEIDLSTVTTNTPISASTRDPEDREIKDDTTSLPDLTSTHNQGIGYTTTNVLTTANTYDEGITDHITTNTSNSASTHNDHTVSSLSPASTHMHNQDSRTSIPRRTTEDFVTSTLQQLKASFLMLWVELWGVL